MIIIIEGVIGGAASQRSLGSFVRERLANRATVGGFTVIAAGTHQNLYREGVKRKQEVKEGEKNRKRL